MVIYLLLNIILFFEITFQVDGIFKMVYVSFTILLVLDLTSALPKNFVFMAVIFIYVKMMCFISEFLEYVTQTISLFY